MIVDRVIQQNATSQSIDIMLRDSTTQMGKTGVVAAGIAFYFVRSKAAPTVFAASDLATIGAAYAAGGIKEYSATDAPGMYRLDVPDSALLAGKDTVKIGWKGAGILSDFVLLPLVPFDPTVVDKAGMKLAADGMGLIVGYVP